jgi:hypothetical protein
MAAGPLLPLVMGNQHIKPTINDRIVIDPAILNLDFILVFSLRTWVEVK